MVVPVLFTYVDGFLYWLKSLFRKGSKNEDGLIIIEEINQAGSNGNGKKVRNGNGGVKV